MKDRVEAFLRRRSSVTFEVILRDFLVDILRTAHAS